MTNKQAKQLEKIITLASSELTQPYQIKVDEGISSNPYRWDVYIWSPNLAFRHELNALMMALDGLRLCKAYQTMNKDTFENVMPDEVIWKCF